MSGRRGWFGPMPRIRLAVLPRWCLGRYSSSTTRRRPVPRALSALTTTTSSPFRPRLGGPADLGAPLPRHVAELGDDALEVRVRLGGLGHEKGLGDRGQRPDRLKHLGARLQVRGLWQRIPKTQRAAASWWERGGLGRAVVVLSRPVGATGPQKY